MPHFHCPVGAYDCPYFMTTADVGGAIERHVCSLGFEGLDPREECDDFYAEWGDANPFDYTD